MSPHRRALAGVCAALMPPEHGGLDPEHLAARVERFLGHLSAPGRAGVLAAAWTLDGAAAVTTGRRLHRLSPGEREPVLDRVASMPRGRDLLDVAKATVSLVAGAETFADDMRSRATEAPPARPDADLRVVPSAHWPSLSRADVVVVGSGAGGAMAARQLAGAGASVVVVEEGRRFGVEEFRTRHPADRFGEMYRDGGATVAVGQPPVLLPIGRGVGGTTLMNSGTCYRPPDRVLRRWRDHHGLGLADPDLLGPVVDEVESTLQVAPVPHDVMGNNGHRLLAGAAALGWDAGPLLRNAPGCGGCCQCAIGCPRNAKFGVHLNALPEASSAGATIVSDLRVDRVIAEAGRASGVAGHRPDGSTVEIRASAVVVAAGATETPPLLRRSGLGGHPRLGANLAVHPALSAAGRFADDITPWDGVLQSAAVDEFHESRGILIEATATPPGMGSMALPGYGRDLMHQIGEAHHLVTLGAMVADRGSGRVLGKRGGRTLLTYRLARQDGSRLLEALGHMGRVLFAAGASEVLTGIPGHEAVTDEASLADAISGADVRRLHLAAFHPTGTAAAGGDPQHHPVDPTGQLRGVDGIWVADASVLPTCPEVNPQVTIMSVASAVAAGLAARLSRSAG